MLIAAITDPRLLLQVIPAKTPQAGLAVEGEDARVDARYARSAMACDDSMTLASQDDQR